MSGRSTRALAGMATAVALLTSGCGIGLGTAGGFVPSGTLAGPVADTKPLDGVSIGVGSKNFSEQVLLGKMAVILLKSAGADVKDLTNIPGSNAARQAQIQDEIQVMWEYTGTGWLTYLGHDKPIPDEQKQYVAVRDEDERKNHLAWLPPAAMNNTYSFAVTEETQKKYGLKSFSDIAKVPVKDRTFCIESEFTDRPDGLKGMLAKYGIPLGKPDGVPRDNLKTLQTGAIYDATAKGQCTFGEVFTTDGRIVNLHLKVLEDDKLFFPLYNVSLVVRDKLLKAHPQIAALFAPITKKLTNDVLLKLNAKIDVDGEDPSDVAYGWLKQEGFLKDS